MDEETKQILESFESRLTKLEALINEKPVISAKKISIKEFLISKNPEDDIQKTLIVGYYLEKYDGMVSFNTKDLETGFRFAKEKVPENLNYKVIKNIEKGYIMETAEKKDKLKSWCLTNLGESYVSSKN